MTWADDYDFAGEFCAIGPELDAWTTELAKELTSGHPLHGQQWRIVARYTPQDEVLVTTESEVYQVHLTWSGQAERPGYPSWRTFNTAEEFEAANEVR